MTNPTKQLPHLLEDQPTKRLHVDENNFETYYTCSSSHPFLRMPSILCRESAKNNRRKLPLSSIKSLPLGLQVALKRQSIEKLTSDPSLGGLKSPEMKRHKKHLEMMRRLSEKQASFVQSLCIGPAPNFMPVVVDYITEPQSSHDDVLNTQTSEGGSLPYTTPLLSREVSGSIMSWDSPLNNEEAQHSLELEWEAAPVRPISLTRIEDFSEYLNPNLTNFFENNDPNLDPYRLDAF
eukprot:TRINITY_DN5388_c0_g1_i2.p1 TRINITY_DN5388_c0_g1~~TRINITY_DN5388_c0_g1_i2.p1  ORF type:complete len:236 (-),score=24.95 TRINITY_DN5388_c0_g1_i2:142-849(-)